MPQLTQLNCQLKFQGTDDPFFSEPKRDKRGQGEGGPSKRDVLFTNTDSNQKETSALDIMPVIKQKKDH